MQGIRGNGSGRQYRGKPAASGARASSKRLEETRQRCTLWRSGDNSNEICYYFTTCRRFAHFLVVPVPRPPPVASSPLPILILESATRACCCTPLLRLRETVRCFSKHLFRLFCAFPLGSMATTAAPAPGDPRIRTVSIGEGPLGVSVDGSLVRTRICLGSLQPACCAGMKPVPVVCAAVASCPASHPLPGHRPQLDACALLCVFRLSCVSRRAGWRMWRV